jgi:hypothetical protein
MSANNRLRVKLLSRLIVNRLPLTVKTPDHEGERALSILRHGSEHYVFPASSIRGWERRATISEALTPAGHPFGTGYQFADIEDALVNISGGVKGSGAADMPALEDQHAFREQNPIIDIWGCGHPAFIHGMVRLGDMVSIEPMPPKAIIRHGVRHNPIMKDGAPIAGGIDGNYTESEHLKSVKRELEDVAKRYKTARRKKEEDKLPSLEAEILAIDPTADFGEKTFDSWLKSKIDSIKTKIKTLGYSDVSIQNLFDSIEEIPIGTKFTHEISIYAARDRIGLYLSGVGRQVLNDPSQGGKKASGCGGNLYREYDFYVLVDEKWVNDATIIFDPGEITENGTTPPQGLIIKPVNGGQIAQACVDEWQRVKHSGVYDYTTPKKDVGETVEKKFSKPKKVKETA